MKILLVLCEGPHDVALLYKVIRFGLRAEDVAALKIKQFPNLIFKHFLSILQNYDYENSQLVGRPEMPTVLTFTQEGNPIYILIYAIGGDSKIEIWKHQIQVFQDLSQSQISSSEISISLALIFDADEGLQNRINNCKENFRELIPDIDRIEVDANICTPTDTFKSIGLYIFSNENGTGNVEDIMMPLMISGNEIIFQEAKAYIDRHLDSNRPSKQKFKKSYDENKSIIGIAGQLQYSGVANQHVIRQSDYINENKILTDPKCLDITHFFSNLLESL